MGYSSTSKLTEQICNKIGWIFSIQAVETMKRKDKIFVRGTLLKPHEARQLHKHCIDNVWIYKGPFA